MKPIRVEFQAFGPYPEYEVVDFSSFGKDGLFLICGKTGTGKTMILDAITFALYGVSSGNGRNDFVSMRCTKADDKMDTFARFEFENNGNRYIFERRAEKKRINISESYSVKQKIGDAEWEVVFENAKEKQVTAKAEEIIGLSADQFRQVIVLPQGQFEKFLTSGSTEKEKILSHIFGETKWEKIAENMFREADERKKKLDGIRTTIEQSLSEVGCGSIEELEAMIGAKKDEQADLKERYAKAGYEEIIKKIDEQLLIVKDYETLHREERKLEELRLQCAEIENCKEKVALGERAEKVSEHYTAVQNAKNTITERRKNCDVAVGNCDKARQNLELAEARLQQHTLQQQQNEEIKRLIMDYEGRIPDYENIDRLKGEYDFAGKHLASTVAEEKAIAAVIEKQTSIVGELAKAYDALLQEQHDYFNRYAKSISGELAKELEDGKPCPVCGSTTHPHKAMITPDDVTKEMVDAKKAECDAKYGEWQAKSQECEDSKKKQAEKHREVETATIKVTEAEMAFNNAKQNHVEGISSLKALMDEVRKLKKTVADYERDRETLEKQKNDAANAVAGAKTALENAKAECLRAEKELAAAEATLAEKLAEHGFATIDEYLNGRIGIDRIRSLQTKVAEYEGTVKTTEDNIAKIKDRLRENEEPNRDECLRIKAEADYGRSEFLKNNATAESEIGNLELKRQKLLELGDGIADKIKMAEEDYSFAKKIRGDSGIGLQRYVLGIMFSSVIDAANEMLKNIHDGRYKLFRTDDKGQGNKRGLELKVHDKYSEEHEGRPVGTLSGGEKFLVSLALSIGMSTIAQRSGIKIEALFIDEGFGTLDEDSINDAMDILRSIRNANGLVGIISHVQLLQEQIDAKLIVDVGAKGSHIREIVG